MYRRTSGRYGGTSLPWVLRGGYLSTESFSQEDRKASHIHHSCQSPQSILQE